MKILFLFFVLNDLQAVSVIRIDQSGVEEFTPFSHRYELIVSDNCTYCLNQMNLMKDCVKPEDVVVLMQNNTNLSEEGLKKVLRKKKIIYKTYLLDKNLREVYSFKGVTPMMWITKNESKKSYLGVLTCENLKLNF